MKAKFITVKGRTKLVLTAENNQERVMMSNIFSKSALDIYQKARHRTKKLSDGSEATEVVIEKVHYLSNNVIESYGFVKRTQGGGRQYTLEGRNIGLFGYGTVTVVKNVKEAKYEGGNYDYIPSGDQPPIILGTASTAEELDAFLELA